MAPKWTPSPTYDGKGLKESDLIKLLVPDPGDVPDVILLKGLMGQSATQDIWRIYVTNDLTEYYEVNAADVVLADHQSGMVRAWVTRGAIRHVNLRKWSAEVEFLSGNLAAKADGTPVTGFSGPDEGFGPEPTKCINHCNTTTR
jgi:hypothetical protein